MTCEVHYSGNYMAILGQQHLPQMRAFIDNIPQTPDIYERSENGPGQPSTIVLVCRDQVWCLPPFITLVVLTRQRV